MRTLPDEDLVARTRAGHREAFGYLVERYQDPLFRYARHMGFGEADARDITQEAFVRAFRHLGRCGDPTRFDGWVFRIAANLCRTFGKKLRRRDFEDVQGTNLLDANPGPHEAAERSSRRRRIREALDRLPAEQREAVVLFYLQGHRVREICDRTGASPSAVKMRLKRGREALKSQLAPLFDEVGER